MNVTLTHALMVGHVSMNYRHLAVVVKELVFEALAILTVKYLTNASAVLVLQEGDVK